MKVEVERIKVMNAGNLVAYADVCIGGCAIIKGCRIVRGENGLFASVPATKGKDDKYYPIVWFKSKELSAQFSAETVKAVEEKIASEVVDGPGPEPVSAEEGWGE